MFLYKKCIKNCQFIPISHTNAIQLKHKHTNTNTLLLKSDETVWVQMEELMPEREYLRNLWKQKCLMGISFARY